MSGYFGPNTTGIGNRIAASRKRGNSFSNGSNSNAYPSNNNNNGNNRKKSNKKNNKKKNNKKNTIIKMSNTKKKGGRRENVPSFFCWVFSGR